jgi:adhesin/invasin
MVRRWLTLLAVGAVAGACGTDVAVNVPPAIAVSKTLLDIDARIDAPPGTGVVHIVNGTAGTLEGLSVTIQYPGTETGWLAASLDRTTATQDQPATLTFTATAENLPIGAHSAVALVSATGAGNGPIRIAVEFNVRPRLPAKIRVVTEPSATAINGAALATAPVIQLVDPADAPAEQAGIFVTVTTSDGVLTGTTEAATDASGRATFDGLTITGLVGAKTLTFAAPDLASATSTPIALAAGPASTLQAISSLAQTADAGTAVADPPKAQVADVSGNPVAGVDVLFVASTGGTIVPAGTIATNPAGIAQLTSWTLRPQAGSNTVTASAPGLTGSPLVFTATGTATTPTVSPTLSTIAASPTAFVAGGSATISVTALDAGGNPVPGATVVLAATGGGGLTQPSSPTSSTGVATGTLSSTISGARVISATVDGVPLNHTVTVTVNPGPATQMIAVTAFDVPVVFGASVAASNRPKVRLVDAFGNGVPNQPVSFTRTTGVGTVTPGSALTDASGFASVTSWTIPALATDYANANVYNRVSASVPGGLITGIVFTGTAAVSYATDLQQYWNDYSCTGCHSGAQAPALSPPSSSSYAALVTGNQRYVIPGDSVTRTLAPTAKNLLIYWPTSANPHTGGTIPSNLLTIIAAWIAQGAKQN